MSTPRAFAAVLTAAVAGLAALAGPAEGAVLDGKQIFLEQKCNMCHAVSSASIERTGKVKGADLAGLAAKEDATWLAKYLRKQADKKGKKHLKPFTGTDEQIGALISWLQKLTPPAAK
ncbi:MAG TPA: cytochrome c [Vicinamibacteria bacterium]|nr:cytochrome c [Vicinamibacteria bacterium]